MNSKFNTTNNENPKYYHNNINDGVIINKCVSGEWLIVKSEKVAANEIKQEHLDNKSLSKNDDSYFPINSPITYHKRKSSSDVKCYILHEIKTEPEEFKIENIKSLTEHDFKKFTNEKENAINCEINGIKIEKTFSNNYNNGFNGIFSEINIKDQELASQNKSKFVLKHHSKIDDNNSYNDVSHLKLKDLINISPRLPAPESRLCKKSMKRRHKNYNKSINEIDSDGDSKIIVNKSNLKRKSPKSFTTKRWNQEEQNNFYKALLVTGTDFTRMASIFPGRSRLDLKKRFKVEEKLNSQLIEKILLGRVRCDPSSVRFDSHLKPAVEMQCEKKSIRSCINPIQNSKRSFR